MSGVEGGLTRNLMIHMKTNGNNGLDCGTIHSECLSFVQQTQQLLCILGKGRAYETNKSKIVYITAAKPGRGSFVKEEKHHRLFSTIQVHGVP